MVLKNIEKIAKHQHALLLAAAAGLALTAALGATTVTSADSSTAEGSEYSKPSTELAQKTDLGKDLSYKKFKSPQFDSLLVHQFKTDSDSDIEHVNSDINGSDYPTDKPHTTFKFADGYATAYSHGGPSDANSHFSDISDAQSSDHDDTMTYFVTKHNLVLRQLFMRGDTDSQLRIVKYHLHSVSKAGNGNKEFIFYPTEYARKGSSMTTIPKKKQSGYPIHLFVNESGHSTSTGSSSHLLP